MKKIWIGLIALGVVFSGVAQSKLDLQSRAALHGMKMLQTPNSKIHTLAKTNGVIPQGHISGLIKIAEGESFESLEKNGVNVVSTRGDIALVTMPVNDVERISTLGCIKQMQLSRHVEPKMDLVRSAIGVDKIHAGTDLPQAYTGKGVITGIVDSGIDPNHINFRDEDGNNRISYISHIYMSEDQQSYYIGEYNTPELVSAFGTDNTGSFHGTHTLGIMAGGYKGVSTVATRKSAFATSVTETNNPYYGVACDSEIKVSCGDLMDMFIALGIENILNEAYEEQKPTVINLSLGSNVGSHDGKSVMSQYLDLAGKEAVICMSAGNEGDLPIALNQTFTADDNVLQSFIHPYQTYSGYYNLRYGQVYVYSNDTTEFTLEAVIYNKSRGTITFRAPVSTNTNGVPQYYASSAYAAEGDITNFNFNRAFDGYVGIGSMIDTDSGRYYAMIDYFTSDNQSTNANGNYILGFVVTGKEGQRIDCFCDGTFTTMESYGIAGWDAGSTNGTISDMACAHNVLVVGSYNTRDEWASLDGKLYSYQGSFPAGKMSPFSSYGTLIDGRNLPHVCAPGAAIISSSNQYYMDAYASQYGSIDDALQAKYVEENRNNYWHQSIGTSMATPVVAGGVALWLEADPTLTIDDVKDIIAKTSVVDADVTGSGDPIQWGAGKFDAYAGLKEVIRRQAGISDVLADDNRLMIKSVGDNLYEVFLGGVDTIDAVLYNISGQPVMKQSVSADETTIDVSSLASGVYVLNVNGVHSQRILVK